MRMFNTCTLKKNLGVSVPFLKNHQLRWFFDFGLNVEDANPIYWKTIGGRARKQITWRHSNWTVLCRCKRSFCDAFVYFANKPRRSQYISPWNRLYFFSSMKGTFSPSCLTIHGNFYPTSNKVFDFIIMIALRWWSVRYWKIEPRRGEISVLLSTWPWQLTYAVNQGGGIKSANPTTSAIKRTLKIWITPRTSDYLGGKQYHTGGESFYSDFERFFRKSRVKSYLQCFVDNNM